MQTTVNLNTDVAVIVPAYNEARSVGTVVEQLRRHFHMVVCIDDGSSDATGATARSAGATVLRHHDNLGQGAALQTGFAFALRDQSIRFAITFDSDGQHRVSDALALLEKARHHEVDIVLGSRFLVSPTSVPFLRRRVLRAGVHFTRLTTGLRLTDTHNGLRVLGRRALEAMDLTLTDMAHASQLLSLMARHRLTYLEAPVTVDYFPTDRRHRQSSLNALNIAFDLAVERMRGRR